MPQQLYLTDGVASSRKLAFQGSDFGFMTGHDVLESRFINGGYALFFFCIWWIYT